MSTKIIRTGHRWPNPRHLRIRPITVPVPKPRVSTSAKRQEVQPNPKQYALETLQVSFTNARTYHTHD